MTLVNAIIRAVGRPRAWRLCQLPIDAGIAGPLLSGSSPHIYNPNRFRDD